MHAPSALRTLYQQRRLIPFVGAGVSMSVTWVDGSTQRRGPSWEELVDQAAQQLGFVMPDLLRVRGTDLQILEYYKLRHSGQFARLTNWLVKHMSPDDASLRRSSIHAALAALEGCRLFYTTNFDDFLEHAFRLHGRQVHEIAVEADMGVRRDDVTDVVKFHGDWNHPDQMVLSESDYEQRLALETPLDLRLRSDLLGRAVLFIGYSFRDPNVAYLFRKINRAFASLPDSLSGRRAYIIVAEPSDFEMRLFAHRNIEVIPVGSSALENEVTALLKEIGS